MEEHYASYLALLDDLRGSLDQLTGLARKKTEAVRRDDLMALDEVIKQEQALALSLRGLEQKRLKLLTRLGLDGVPLSGLAARYPAGLQPQATQTVNALKRSYESYRTAAQTARSTLELNLHELERIVAAQGGNAAQGAGYTPPAAQPPENMKTDFRA